MIITKLGHSCLIVEEAGTRILIGPGTYTFQLNESALDSMKGIGAIFITHEHADHCDQEKLAVIIGASSNPAIYTTEALATQLRAKGISAAALRPGDVITSGSFTIKGVDCRHGTLPAGFPTPQNVGLLINDELFHPGDCTLMEQPPKARILALPAIAPWGSTTQAVTFAGQVKPELVFPIHDAIMRFPELTNFILQKSCNHLQIVYKPLGPGDALDVPRRS